MYKTVILVFSCFMAVNSHAQDSTGINRRIDFSARHIITTHVLVAPDLSYTPGPAKRIDFSASHRVTIHVDPVPDTTHYVPGPSRRIDFSARHQYTIH